VTLGPDDWVIQNAANSAVGLYLVQLAGFRVTGPSTSCGATRRPPLYARPAAIIVLVDGEDLAERVPDATNGAEIRLGIDAVAGAATGRLADGLCESATLVSYGRMSSEACAIQADAFVFRDLTVRGFWLVSWYRRTVEQQRRACGR
jgi:trans-2-enoyl-CoA reductase